MTLERMVSRGLLLSALLLAACRVGPLTVAGQPTGATSADGVIAGTVSSANDGEIAHAHIALERAADTEVVSFARRMLAEHTTAAEQLQRVLRRMNTLEAGSPFAAQIEERATLTAEALRAVPAESFDHAYMKTQVDIHEWLLRTLDETLIPGARDQTLQAQLRMLRTSVVDHLDRARKINSRLDR